MMLLVAGNITHITLLPLFLGVLLGVYFTSLNFVWARVADLFGWYSYASLELSLVIRVSSYYCDILARWLVVTREISSSS